jgi:hypothetical protein
MATTQLKDGFDGGSDNQLLILPDGSINVNTSGGSGATAVNLTKVGGTAIALGETNAAASLPVVIASDQTPIPIEGSITGPVDTNLNGLTNWQTSQYPIGPTPIQITPTPLTNRSSLNFKVICTGSNIVWLGNSNTVSPSTGFPLFNGDTTQLDLTPGSQIWAMCTAAGQMGFALELGD